LVCISSLLVRDIHRTAARPSSLLQTSHSPARPCSSTRRLLSNVSGYLSGAPVLSFVRRATLANKPNSYLIIIKSLLPNVVASLYHDLSSPGTNPPAWALSGRIWISLLMAVLLPLSFLRRLDSLRHTSYIALFSCGEYHGPLLHKSEKMT
jgi:transmembrane amino acid transporter